MQLGTNIWSQTCNYKKGSDCFKRRVVGSKGGWKLSTILSCKVFRDWSIIKLREINDMY